MNFRFFFKKNHSLTVYENNLMKNHSWLFPILMVTGVLISAPSIANNTLSKKNSIESSRTIAAVVNNRPIYLDQLTAKTQAKIDKYKRFNRGSLPPEHIEKKMQEAVLNEFINAELIYQASQALQVENIEAKIDQKLIEQQAQHRSSTEILGKQANRTAIKQQILIDEYLKKHHLFDPQPPEKELKAFYEKNKHQFESKQDKVHVLHILMNDKNEIERVRQQILNGTSFSEAAKKHSKDANAPSGGDLGFIEKGYMPKEFDNIAFTIKPNTLSEIIKTENGYHILKVLEKHPQGTAPTFENMKMFLRKGFAPKLKANNISKHIEELRKKANIEIRLNTIN